MKRILVVDDSSLLRQAVVTCLVGSGYEVTEAKDGVEALGLAIKSQFDAVISDNYMPFMEGVQLVEALRELVNYQTIPILILSTEAKADVKRKGRDVGVTGWIQKPFNAVVLLFKLERLLS